MSLEHHAAYLALRTYLEFLLAASTDHDYSDIPVALSPNLAAFMEGKTGYQNSSGQRMVYTADLAAWANDVVHGSDLAIALPSASLSVAELQTVTRPATEC